MVDLVKIRKKAKDKQDSNGSQPQQDSPATATVESLPSAPPAVESIPPAPKVQKSAKPKQHSAPPTERNDAKESRQLEPVVNEPVAPAVPAMETASHSAPAPDAPAIAEAPQNFVEARTISKLERFKQRAGRLREDATLAGVSADSTQHAIDESALELLSFAIAGEHYAIDIEHIVEIVPARTTTRVPNADPSIVGILSLRGTIVTLIDVRRRLGHAQAEVTSDTRIVVVEHQGETIGFEVDRVFRVVKVPASDVAAHPVVHSSELDESIRGVFRQADALTILLDFDKLLDRRESPRNGAVEAVTSPL